MKLILLAFLFLAACTSMPNQPAPSPLGKKTCVDIPNTKNPAKVCHWRTCDVPKGVLWYQHGLLETEQSVDAPGSIFVPAHSEFKALAKDFCYDIVSMSWGTSWMIRPPGTLALTPPSPAWGEAELALDFVVQRFALQRPFLGYGTSMGSFNLATIALLKPTFFDRLIVAHAVIEPFPIPFNLASVLISQNFTIQEWLVANPIEAVKKVSSMSKAYITACRKDEFGLWAGPKAYADAAIARGFDITFNEEPVGCKHTSLNVPPVVEWLKK